MFKKLKDKIAEELKDGEQRIQQIAQAAQAAVSSSSLVSNPPEVSSSDQFFSITEEDTPQNSPHRTVDAVSPSGATTATLKPITSSSSTNGLSPQSMSHLGGQRQRRLSNSSMASDVSFRLPSYDSPAVYHLQSDLDCSASEYEDTASNAGGAQLDRISKEQLHSAYKKASDRYQKYRSRYTEIAARYRDLERDNNKARSVLVETQDKALRRISELREQCALEQQAKAHLESALRLEMDEMQCVIKTLKSKLTTVDSKETSLMLENGQGEDALDKVAADPPLLLDLMSTDEPEIKPGVTDQSRVLELEEKIRSLESAIDLYKTQMAEEHAKEEVRNKDVQSLEESVRLLNENLNASIEKIKGLQAREEENTILLAENKMMVHSELEAKDDEVKTLRERIQQMESIQGQFESDNKNLQAKVTSLSSQITDLESSKHDKEAKLNELEGVKIKLKEEASRMDGQLSAITAERDLLAKQLEEHSRQTEKLTTSSSEEIKSKLDCIEKMETELLELKTQLKLKDQEMTEQLSKINSMDKEHKQALKEEQKRKEGELSSLNDQIKDLQESLSRLTDDNQKLTEEVKMTKVINENSESEAIQSLQATMTRQAEEWEVKMNAKEEHIGELNRQIKEYEGKSEALNSEWESLKKTIESHEEEMVKSKGEIEALRKEKQDLEETLEKEIQTKSELQTELTRLEGQYNDTKEELEALESTKSQLQEKIANLEKEALDKEELSKSTIDGQVKILEDRLKEAEEYKKDVASKNELLVERMTQLENTIAESDEKHQRTVHAINEDLLMLKSGVAINQADTANLFIEKEQLEQALRTVEEQKEAIEREKQGLMESNTTLEEELRVAKRDVFVMKDKIMGLEQQLETAQEKSDDLEAQINELKQEIEDSKTMAKSVEETKSSSDEEIERLKKELTDIQNGQEEELRIAKRDNFVMKDKVMGLEQQLETAQEKSDNLEAQINELRQEIEESKTLVKSAEETKSSSDEEIERLKKELTETDTRLQEELRIAKRDSFVMKDKAMGLEQQLETAQEKSDDLEAQLTELRQEIEDSKALAMSAEETKTTADEEIARLKKELAEIEYRHSRADEETQKSKLDLEKELKDMENIKVENEYLNTHVKQLEGDLQKLRDETVLRESLLREIKDKYNFAENEMSNLQEQKSKFDCLMADKDHELDQTNVQLVTCKQELEGVRVTHKTQLSNLAEEVKELRSEISAKQIIINDLNQDLSRQEKELGHAKSGQVKELESLQRANEELQKEVKELSGNSSAHDELREKCENMERLNAELRMKISELETRLQDNVVQKSRIELESSSKAGELDELREENETLKLKFHNLERTLNSKLGVLDEKHKDLIDENRTLKEQVDKGSAQVVEGWEQEKAEMEQRLQKIIGEVQEVSSRNMFLEQKVENFLVLEQTNERMKLANEKLSRQLDETLVTMHHNEGIAANTEFEYLKNIMFQYLSGSMNSNSSTLVKVISAVLKFTPQQTQVVLEKENHRHTLLGQINKIM